MSTPQQQPSRHETLAGLRPADYNPRRITPRQREELQRSLLEYGPLDGIVYNRRTSQLVGGHQRRDVFKDRSTRVVKQAYRDAQGTVARGVVRVPLSTGGFMEMPYREVDWPPEREMAANVAANASGGSFDDVKLGRLLVRLERGRFPIESIPIDPVDLRRAFRAEEVDRIERAGIAEPIDGLDAGRPVRSQTCTCPSCGYAWDPKAPPEEGRQRQSGTPETRKRQRAAEARRLAAEGPPARRPDSQQQARRPVPPQAPRRGPEPARRPTAAPRREAPAAPQQRRSR